MPNTAQLLILLAAYLIGSVSFAVLISKMFGLADPRQYGSGNPGATNVLRSGNKPAAILTLVGDAFKGTFAVLLAAHFAPENHALIAVSGVVAFIGHLYPVFLKFRGGKGVATAIGVLLGFSPLLALYCLLIWLAIVTLSRYSSLAALVTALLTPIITWYLLPEPAYIWAALMMSILLIWRHQENITRLLNGSEGKIGKK